MYWRLPSKEWTAGNGSAARDPVNGNKVKFERVVASGEPTGLLAYVDGAPAGWVAVAPRDAFPRVFRSTTVAPLDPDEAGVWSVNCFFVARRYRRSGLASDLLTAAVTWAKENGAASVEGYPVLPAMVRGNAGDYYTGTVGQFEKAGFVLQPRENTLRRVVMRRTV